MTAKTVDGVAFEGQEFIPHGFGGQKSCIRASSWSSSSENPLLGFRPLTSGRIIATLDIERGSSLGSLFSKDANSSHEGSTLMARSPAKAPPPNVSSWGLELQHMN